MCKVLGNHTENTSYNDISNTLCNNPDTPFLDNLHTNYSPIDCVRLFGGRRSNSHERALVTYWETVPDNRYNYGCNFEGRLAGV